MLLLIFVTFLFGGVLGAQTECPPKEDVFPCSCESDYFGTTVSCTRIEHLDVVIPVLKNTRAQEVSYHFFRSRLGNIPSDVFEGQKSASISFFVCQIGSFGDRPFSGLENTLTSLSIVRSVDKTQDFEAFPLGHLKALETLWIADNNITKFGNDWFEGGPEKLGLLFLYNNNIGELGDRAFASLVNVHTIKLEGNPIKKVSRSMFPCPGKLEGLYMRSCGIEELPEDFFECMPGLKSIDLSGNRLKTIPYATWGEVWNQLHAVKFDNKDLECDYRLKWIYQQKLPDTFEGSCGGSNRLSGRKLSELRLEDFH